MLKIFTGIFCLFFSISVSAQTNWNTEGGLPVHVYHDAVVSFSSASHLPDGSFAYLLPVEKAVRVISPDGTSRDFALPVSGYSMTLSGDVLWILGNKTIVSLNMISGSTTSFVTGSFDRIHASENNIYLYTSSRQTWLFNPLNGKTEFLSNSQILDQNCSVQASLTAKHSFKLNINGNNYNYHTVKRAGAVLPAAVSGNDLFVEIQLIVSEVPLQVEKELWKISLTDGSVVRVSVLPSSEYVRLHDEYICGNNGLFFVCTTPEGPYALSLDAPETWLINPSFCGYHYNHHLAPAGDENACESVKTVKAPITRTQIILNAEPYETHAWICSAANIKDYYCGGKQVVTPSWVTVGPLVAFPYMWGGWSNPSQFNTGITNGVSAGDCNTVGGGAGASCAVGVDCSGFVSRAWNLATKYGTSTLPNISVAYSSFSELLPGDIVNYAGHHVRLIHTCNGNGTWLMLESSASATDWRVGYSTYDPADLQGTYIPRYYQDVISSPVDTVPPQTICNVSGWKTQDFQVNFSDNDNSGIRDAWWLIAGKSAGKLLAPRSYGFMFDDFNTSADPAWINVEPTWSVIGGSLNQSNESITNNNSYIEVKQDSLNGYLYHWKMKLTGSGGDRRAGMYFFSDSATLLQRNNAYMVYYRVDLDAVQIYRSTNNSITLMEEDPCSIDESSWFDCKVFYNPESGLVEVYYNDIMISSWTDPNPLQTGKYISLRTGACNAYFDDISVYKSRSSVVDVSVGPGNMQPYQNEVPVQSACAITALSRDNSDLISSTNQSLVNVDWTPPVFSGTVTDNNPADQDTTTSQTTLGAHWPHADDPNSSVTGYLWAIGTSPGSNNLTGWNSDADTFLSVNTLTLQPQTLYYFSVKAVNGAGLESAALSSDGIFTDFFVSCTEQFTDGFTVYPNPAQDHFKVTTGGTDVDPIVYTLSGAVCKIPVYATSDGYVFSTEGLSNGLYNLVLVQKNGDIIHIPVVIQR